MNFVKPSHEILAASGYDKDFPYSYSDPKKLIERAGRTCYKSEGNISVNSAEKFIEMIKRRGHLSVMEHSWSVRYYRQMLPISCNFLYVPPGVNVPHWMYAGNLRAFAEAINSESLKREFVYDEIPVNYLTMHKFLQDDWLEGLAVTVKFICDRGITHELVRHRPISFSQESTRYCNYGKLGMTFVIPEWLNNWVIPGEYDVNSFRPHTELVDCWYAAMIDSERTYLNLLKLGWSPQQARSVLPNSLKTEIVCTANLREWQHIFKWRTSAAAHPQMRELMIPFFKKMGELYSGVFDVKGD